MFYTFLSRGYPCRAELPFQRQTSAGLGVTTEVVIGTVVASIVVGSMVWIAVVVTGVWTGAGAEVDVHPAMTNVTIRQTPIQIEVLLSII